MSSDQSFEDKYLDVLQNLEFSILRVYREHPALTDRDALDAIEGLIHRYTAESRGRARPDIRLLDLAQLVFDSVEVTCEWRLGRQQTPLEVNKPADVEIEPKTLDEIIACLKRIRKSIKRWSKEGGRQGYLDFVSEFVL